jgi:hypothetical protein
MRILITGGAGCLGSNLIEHWLPQDHEIFVIDNFATGKREVVPEVPGLTVKEGSIVDQELVDACFAQFQPEVVVHAAAAYKDPDDWVEDSRTNVIGSAPRCPGGKGMRCQAPDQLPDRAVLRPPAAVADSGEPPHRAVHQLRHHQDGG